MLTISWDYMDVIYTDLAGKGLRINSTYYSDLMRKCKRKRQKHGDLSLWLLQDNISIQMTAETMSIIEKNSFVLFDHPPYSPDLTPSYFYLFRHIMVNFTKKTLDLQ